MNTKEIINTVAMYNAIMEGILKCHEENQPQFESGEEFDYLWLQCKKTDYYTNNCCIIMPPFTDDDSLEDEEYKNFAETAARYTEICLQAGATPSDLYLGY